MLTPISKRPIPEGFTSSYDADTWNIGILFNWAEYYGQYYDNGIRFTVGPGENPREAYGRIGLGPLTEDQEIFFVKE